MSMKCPFRPPLIIWGRRNHEMISPYRATQHHPAGRASPPVARPRQRLTHRHFHWRVLAAAVPVAGLVVPAPAAAAAAAPATTAPGAGAGPAARVWSAPTRVHREAYEVLPALSPNRPTPLALATAPERGALALGGSEAPAATGGEMHVLGGAAPGVPVLVSPASLWRFTYSPVVSAAYTDPEGDAGTVTFTVLDHAGATAAAVTSPVLASGATASVDLAAAPLPTGWYSWSATASDGTSTSAATTTRKFHVAVLPSTTPRAGVKPAQTFEDFTLADRVQLQVNVGSGNLLLRAKDLAIAGTAGHNLSLQRVYNNRHTSESTREMGRGWSLGPGQHVALYHAPGNAGRDLVFEDETQARWTLTWVFDATQDDDVGVTVADDVGSGISGSRSEGSWAG